MILKGFEQLDVIKKTIEDTNNELVQKRQSLFDTFNDFANEYENHRDVYSNKKADIQRLVDQVVPLFNTQKVSDTQLKSIEEILSQLRRLFGKELSLPVVEESLVAEVSNNETKNESDAILVSIDSLEEYQSELLEQVKTTLSNRAFLKENHSTQGLRTLGTLRVMYQHWYRTLQQFKKSPRDKKIAVLLDKHHDKIQDLIEVINEEILNFHELHSDATNDNPDAVSGSIIEEDKTATTSSTDTVKEPLLLDNSMLVEERPVEANTAQRLTIVSLPEAGQKEINESPRAENGIESTEAGKSEFEAVHRMEATINLIDEEIKQLQQTGSWRPSHETGNTRAIIDQFDLTLADYYEQPSASLFEQLKSTFASIEAIYNEARDTMVSELSSATVVLGQPQDTILSREMSVTEEKANNIITIADKYKAERESIGQVVDELLSKPNLPAHILQSLSFAQSEMLTRLGLLSYTDPQYIQLRERVKEVIHAAQLQSELEVTVAPAPKIEGVANQNLAPQTKERLIKNPKLVAALVVVIASVLSPEKLSEYADRVPVVSADIGATLNNIGSQAVWGTEAISDVPVAVDEVTNEVVRIPVHPYTREVAEEEARMTPSISAPEVLTETVSMPVAATHEDGEPSVAEVAAVSYDATPSKLEPMGESDLPPQVTDTVLNRSTAGSVIPRANSEDFKEKNATGESAEGDDAVIEVVFGDKSTLPDRAIDTVFATVDTKGLPEILVTRLKANVKTTFLNNQEWLRMAGVTSGQKDVTFPGEKIDYHDPKESLIRVIDEQAALLGMPHAGVAQEDDNLTTLTQKTFASDLNVLPEPERLVVTETAISHYLATPGALDALRLQDKGKVMPGAIIPLQGIAPHLAEAVGSKVRELITTSSVEDVALDEPGGASEVLSEAGEPLVVTSPENYPGGVLEYSKAFNEKLASLGIAPKVPSMIDSWFQPRTADNRGLLEMTVGELNRIMLQKPQEVMQEFGVRNITLPSAEAVNTLIREARQRGAIPSEVDVNLTIADLLQAEVLAEASKSSN